MNKYEIKTKGVSFNVLDPDQEKLFKYANTRPNFSGYVKRLIQRDVEYTQVYKPKDESSPDVLNEDYMDNLI